MTGIKINFTKESELFELTPAALINSKAFVIFVANSKNFLYPSSPFVLSKTQECTPAYISKTTLAKSSK